MSNCTLTLEPILSGEDIQAVKRILIEFNRPYTEPENWQALYVVLRNEEKQIIGGLLGYTHWGWLYVDNLAVTESLRGQGYGKALMKLAEEEAVRRGCRHAYLDTFDFQARGMYEKLGYEVYGSLEDYPPGHFKYFLRKQNLSEQR